MILKSAELNQEGIQSVLNIAADPSMLDTGLGSRTFGFAGEQQVFISGVSIPGGETPFHVPVIGDNEAFTLVIEQPSMLDSSFAKRVTFVCMLIAESVRVQLPQPDEFHESEIDFLDAEDEADFRIHSSSYKEEEDDLGINEAYDDYTGDWGGFLRAVVETRHVSSDDAEEVTEEHHGHAELHIFENEAEWRMTQTLLEKGLVNAYDITRLASLGALAILARG